MLSIDLNADLGEHPGTNLDEQIMPFLSSCNVACGGHIGDEGSVRQTILLAKQHSVAVGAHPSYPDLGNFGRIILTMQPDDLATSIKEQIHLVKRICEEEEVALHHIKPHGALYNRAAKDAFISELVLKVIEEVAPNTYWMGLAGSTSEEVARRHGYSFIAEGFADRQYEPDGSLRSRTLDGAVLQKTEVLKQVEELAVNNRVNAGGWLTLNVQSICLHSDTEGAVTLAKEIHEHLVNKGIQIAAV
ncbi:5-oxoprolinase subunit PxpA [Ekhidna sp. MALMAid0563]|uniref:5-oxoprolinase subunit PxpA n=1 Tax=Ekhidna sp. MALMAid0563 TaxID=3143937 RepID=UPI0032DFB480